MPDKRNIAGRGAYNGNADATRRQQTPAEHHNEEVSAGQRKATLTASQRPAYRPSAGDVHIHVDGSAISQNQSRQRGKTPANADTIGEPVARGALNNLNLRDDMSRRERNEKRAQREAKRKAKASRRAEKVRESGKHPLFVIDGDSNETLKSAVIVTVGIAIAAGIYVVGVVTNTGTLTILSFAVIIVCAAVWMWRRRRLSYLTDKQIDEAVNAFKRDLVETYNGYDVPYTAADIEEQTRKYRAELEEDNASIAELSPSMMLEAVKANRAKTKEIKEASKELRRLDKQARKAEKRRK